MILRLHPAQPFCFPLGWTDNIGTPADGQTRDRMTRVGPVALCLLRMGTRGFSLPAVPLQDQGSQVLSFFHQQPPPQCQVLSFGLCGTACSPALQRPIQRLQAHGESPRLLCCGAHSGPGGLASLSCSLPCNTASSAARATGGLSLLMQPPSHWLFLQP